MSQRIVISYLYHMGKSGSIYLLISFFPPSWLILQQWHLFWDSGDTQKTLAVSASTWRQDLSLIGHFCSLSSRRHSRCSCTGCLIIHVILVQLAASCDTVWHTESARRTLPGVGLVERVKKQRDRDSSTAVLCPLTPPSPPTPPPHLTLLGVAWLTLKHILSGKSSSGCGSGLGYCLWEELSITQGGSNLRSSAASLNTFSFSNSPLLYALSSPLEQDKRHYVRYWARNELNLSKWCSPGSLYVVVFFPSCRLSIISYFQMFSLCAAICIFYL